MEIQNIFKQHKVKAAQGKNLQVNVSPSNHLNLDRRCSFFFFFLTRLICFLENREVKMLPFFKKDLPQKLLENACTVTYKEKLKLPSPI